MDRVYTHGTLGNVPNKPKTPVTAIRIPVELKKAVAEKAASKGETLTDVVLRGLESYVKRP